MNNRLPARIMYALGCTLVLSLHSLTPRNTFAQPRENAAATPAARDATVTGAPSTRAASVSVTHPPARSSTSAVSDSGSGARAGAGSVGHEPSSSTPSVEQSTRIDAVSSAHGPPSSAGAGASGARAATVGVGQAPPIAAASTTASARTGSVSDARAQASAPASAHDASGTPSEHPGVVNLNTATDAELERLPRIGPARAQAILALRAKLTRFSKVEQLLRVKGIGRATFRNLRPMLSLDGPTTLPERKSR